MGNMEQTITLGATSPPKVCVRCGAYPSLHGGTNRQIRRHGWYSYLCGSRWHADYGFKFDDGCTLSVLREFLIKVARMRDMAKVRRATHDILNATVADSMPVRRFRVPIYDETKIEAGTPTVS